MVSSKMVGRWLAKRDELVMCRAGLSFVEIGDGTAMLQLVVERDMLNSGDICQGGFVFALADHAFAFACLSNNRVGYTLSADIVYTSPAYLGDTLTATATIIVAKGRIITCDVPITNQHGDSVALFRGVWYRKNEMLISKDNINPMR